MGTYSNNPIFLCHHIIIRQASSSPVILTCIPHKNFHKNTSAAVTCFCTLKSEEYFVAGFSNGSVNTYNINTAEPIF